MRTKPRSCLAVLAAFFFLAVAWVPAPQAVVAQTSAWSEPIPLSSIDAKSWFPDIFADPYGKLHVAWASAMLDFDTVMYASSDDGVTWTLPNDVAGMPTLRGETYATRPTFAMDAVANLNLTYKGGNYTYLIQTAISSAGNASAWSSPVVLSGSYTAYFSKLAIDGEGIYHYFYTENVPSALCSMCYHLFYRQSKDSGSNWSDPVDLTFEPNGAAKPQVVVDRWNNLHVAWEAGAGGDLGQLADSTTVSYKASYDGGDTWSPTYVFPLAEDETAKNIAIGIDRNQRLIVAWLAVPSDWIMYQISDTSGKSWSEPLPIPDVWGGFDAFSTKLDSYAMANDSLGNLHLVAVGRLNQFQLTLDLLHLVWDGEKWSAPEVITSYTGDAPEWPRIAVSNGNQLNVVWFVRDEEHIWDSDNGRYRVWYSSSLVEAPFVPDQRIPTAAPTTAPTLTATPAGGSEDAAIPTAGATVTSPPRVENLTPPVNVPTTEMDYLPLIGMAVVPSVLFVIVILLIALGRRK